MVEADLKDETPTSLLIGFAVLTAVLISVHLVSLTIATRLLPEIEAFINNPKLKVPQTIAKGHYWPVQLVWYLSNILGVLLFLMELVLVTYVKFYPQNITQAHRVYIGTGTLVLVSTLSIVCLPFVIVFFRSLSRQKIRHHERKLERARTLLEIINQNGSFIEPI